jgi:ribosomal peptide maturation radical SAM protein 1
MPFAPSSSPSLGLSLLRAALSKAGFAATVHYATLPFARIIGWPLYDQIADASPDHLVGDWVFAGALAPQSPARAEAYVSAVLAPAYGAEFVDGVRRARAAATAFVAAVVDEVLAGEPLIVGFTSTFAQNTAALAAARAIKVCRPDVAIVLGGANCEGEMAAEIVRRFSFVDAVVSGEGEIVITELAERMLARRRIDELPGVYTRGGTKSAPYANAPAVADLDMLPLPDFSDFYAAVDAADPGREAIVPLLLVEASRGCWWGAKHHCTFCGLNGSAMGFRSKSPDRFVAELRRLTELYGVKAVAAVDNIMDFTYFRTALPMLAASNLDLSLFFEIKANLRREHVALLSAAGVRAVQPGIESLDSGVLRLMRKGVSALQNVQLLKLCKEYGVAVAWNILAGFPHEDPAAYGRMAKSIALLTHLPPPGGVTPVRMDRFSPLFEARDSFGVVNVRPARAYAHVYGGRLDELSSLAYYFAFDYPDGRDVLQYTRKLSDAVRNWRAAYEHSDLCLLIGESEIRLVDRRPAAKQRLVTLSGVERTVYAECDEIQTVASLVRAAEAAGSDVPTDDIAAACRKFVGDGLMIEEDGKYLSLSVSPERGGISPGMRKHFESAIRALDVTA